MAVRYCPSHDLRCKMLAQKNHRLGTQFKSVCFGGICWNASLVNPEGRGARGPSVEVWRGSWGESLYLLPIFNNVLGGTCMQPDGTRKVVVDGALAGCRTQTPVSPLPFAAPLWEPSACVHASACLPPSLTQGPRRVRTRAALVISSSLQLEPILACMRRISRCEAAPCTPLSLWRSMQITSR